MGLGTRLTATCTCPPSGRHVTTEAHKGHVVQLHSTEAHKGHVVQLHSTEAHKGHVVQLHRHVIFHCSLPLHAILPLQSSIANTSNSIAALLAKFIDYLNSAHTYESYPLHADR